LVFVIRSCHPFRSYRPTKVWGFSISPFTVRSGAHTEMGRAAWPAGAGRPLRSGPARDGLDVREHLTGGHRPRAPARWVTDLW